jgi:hypothetical protein
MSVETAQVLDAERLACISADAEAWATDALIESRLRTAYPDLHFTFCSEDDIPEMSPAKEGKAFHLYLVDGRDHCMKLTSDAGSATGVVVASVEEEL